ncbi:MAG: DEAD/DEAH box helicase [Campylobacterota bacterium]|nr:DEAD/DEAH box helicase [Campylobacterota bacterium]
MGFSQFKLSTYLEKSLKTHAFKEPTPIQTKVIPLVLESRDIIAKAQTGSGKTASFVLPILQKFIEGDYKGKPKIRTLVITPTRELALQVADTFKLFSTKLEKKPKIVTTIGGVEISKQLDALHKGCDILVATSGRFLDILSKKQITLEHLEFFVLDEADKMLDQGFADQLDDILEALPKNRQNLLFSATYPQRIETLVSTITNNPIKVTIEDESETVENITQRAILVNQEKRNPLLKELLKINSWKKVLVFVATNRGADNLANKFIKYGFNAESFHGHLDQDERNYTLEDFKDKKINILFSSDISARGLHIDDIECVINYDLPRSPNDYIHRIGRTARAGKSGEAISFITKENFEHFKLIEKRSNIKLTKEKIEGFEFTGTPVSNKKGKAPVKGKRKSKKDKLREQQAKD